MGTQKKSTRFLSRKIQLTDCRASCRALIIATALSATAISGSGCTTIAVGTAAIVALDIAHDRRTVGEYIDDGTVELKIRQKLLADPEIRGRAHISVTALNGIVLLTGETPTDDVRTAVLQHTQGHPEIRQVLDEMQLSGKSTWAGRMNDTWITSKVKTRLINETQLDANRVKVVTEYGNVYLMGLLTEDEGHIAAESARTVGGVSRVIKVFEYIN